MTTQPNNSISDERNFRPKTLEDFIGQSDLKKTLRLMLDSAHQRSATLERVVFYGGPMSREDPIGSNHRCRAGYQPILEMVSTTPLVRLLDPINCHKTL
jgi:hypothetical protein